MLTPTNTAHAPVNGLDMYYEIYGTGNDTIPLVLIHGGGSTIQTSFGNLLPLLLGYSKIIAMELQAHGRTSDRDAPEPFEQDADDVVTLLDFLNISKANFLGFSNGGTTALQIAIRHPQIVNKIIVVSANYTKAGMVPDLFDGLRLATLNDMPGVLKEAFLKVTPDQTKLQTMFEKDRDRMLNFKDIADEQIRSIKAPALLMVGDRDVMTVDHVLKMSHLIPGAQLVVLPGLHGTMIGEAGSPESNELPRVTANLVKEFLLNNYSLK
jgi:pimeloyl-ACP methyl ester carboxylesterase